VPYLADLPADLPADPLADQVAIRPGDLYRPIEELTTRLERIALAKAPAPVEPPVNRAFNSSRHPEALGEATNQRSRRI